MSKRNTHLANSFLYVNVRLKHFTSDHLRCLGPEQSHVPCIFHYHVMDLFDGFRNYDLNRPSRMFATVCTHMTTPKISKPHVYHINRWSRLTLMFVLIFFLLENVL